MWLFKSRTKLTSTEREAIARLRQRRATGDLPAVLTHAVPHTPVGPPPTFGAAFLLRGRGKADKEGKRREKQRAKAERARTRALAAGFDEDTESSRSRLCGLGAFMARFRRGGSEAEAQVPLDAGQAGGGGLREKLVNVGSRLKEVVSGNMGDDDDSEEDSLVKKPSVPVTVAGNLKRKTMRLLSRRKEAPKLDMQEDEPVDPDTAYFQNLMVRA